MNLKKRDVVLIIVGLISLVIGIIFKCMLMDIDDAIITYGYQTTRTYQLLSNVMLGISLLMVIIVLGLHVLHKKQVTKEVKEISREKVTNPHYEENSIASKLEALSQSDVSYQTELRAANEHLAQINDCLADLHDLQENNEYELLIKISFSMLEAKTQILHNIKSIINRVTIEGDRSEINKRLESNSKIIQQVRALLNETVNYLDSKSPSTSEDLENMTKALQSLNKTIE